MASNRAEFEPLIQAIVKPAPGKRVSAFVEDEWNYFMIDGVDTQLSNPDSYPFSRIFVQAPFWIAILFTKLNILPPSTETEAQIASNATSNRTSPAERRRIQWGFIPILIPLFGIPDPLMRKYVSIFFGAFQLMFRILIDLHVSRSCGAALWVKPCKQRSPKEFWI